MKRTLLQRILVSASGLAISLGILVGAMIAQPNIAAAACDCECLSGTTTVASSEQGDQSACEEFCKGVASPGELTAFCSESSTQTLCTRDDQCQLGNVCKNGVCRPAECNETNVCTAPGTVCSAGQCVVGQCNSSIPCPSGKICQGTICVTPTSASSNTQSGASILAGANPIKGSDIRTVIGRVITIFTGLSGTLALIMFIYGGVLYLFSQGDDTQVARAQGVFKWSTIGLLLIFTSYAILNQIFSGLEAQFGQNTEGIAYANLYPLGQISPAVLVGNIIQYALGFVGVAALLVFIWGGFQYFLSMGDAKRAESGRKTVVYAVIGLVLIFISYAATTFVVNTLNNPLSGAERPQSGDDVPTPPDPDADGGAGLDGAGLITPTFATCGACTCVLGSASGSQETRTPLSGNFQTESECDTRCRLQFTSQLKRTECSQSGTTTTPGVDGNGVGGACGQCTCSVRVGGSPAGSIEERPLESGLTIGQCSSRCSATFGANLVRSNCR